MWTQECCTITELTGSIFIINKTQTVVHFLYLHSMFRIIATYNPIGGLGQYVGTDQVLYLTRTLPIGQCVVLIISFKVPPYNSTHTNFGLNIQHHGEKSESKSKR